MTQHHRRVHLVLLVALGQLPVTVTVTVVDEDDRPLKGVVVSREVAGAAGTNRRCGPQCGASTRETGGSQARETDSRGRAMLRLPPGEHLLRLIPEYGESAAHFWTTIDVSAQKRAHTVVYFPDSLRTTTRISSLDGGTASEPRLEAMQKMKLLWRFCFESGLDREPNRTRAQLTATVGVARDGTPVSATITNASPLQFSECIGSSLRHSVSEGAVAREVVLEVELRLATD